MSSTTSVASSTTSSTMSTSIFSTSPLPSIVPSNATTVLPPVKSCTPGAVYTPPGNGTTDVLTTGAADSFCAVGLYGQDYNSSQALSAMRDCCGNFPVNYYTDGCGLYCHASNNGNASDFSALQTCIRGKLDSVLCQNQSAPRTIYPSSSSTPTSSPTSSTSAKPSSGAIRDAPLSKAAGFVALLALVGGIVGVAA